MQNRLKLRTTDPDTMHKSVYLLLVSAAMILLAIDNGGGILGSCGFSNPASFQVLIAGGILLATGVMWSGIALTDFLNLRARAREAGDA